VERVQGLLALLEIRLIGAAEAEANELLAQWRETMADHSLAVIAPRGVRRSSQPGYDAWRWTVERPWARLHRSRHLLIRCEDQAEKGQAMSRQWLHLLPGRGGQQLGPTIGCSATPTH
jgi:hypothetical protein